MNFQIPSTIDGELAMTLTEKGRAWKLPRALFGCIFDLECLGAS